MHSVSGTGELSQFNCGVSDGQELEVQCPDLFALATSFLLIMTDVRPLCLKSGIWGNLACDRMPQTLNEIATTWHHSICSHIPPATRIEATVHH